MTIGQVGKAESLTGTMTFDGSGHYTLTGQVSDTTVNAGAPAALSTSGNYAVNASGVFMIDNPLSAGDEIFGGVGTSAITGSSTESAFFDFMVAVPMESGLSNAAFHGTYRMVGMDYPNGDVTKVLNSTFVVQPDGSGNLGTIMIAGHAEGVSDSTFNQTVTGGTYSLAGTAGTMTFPNSNSPPLINGAKQFYISADGNVVVAGALDGYDIEVGINVGGSAASSTMTGMYFSGGEDSNSSYFSSYGYYYLDAFYGSINAHTPDASTVVYAHDRLNQDDTNPYDYTFDDEFSFAADGTATETGYQEYFAGAGGSVRVVVGLSNYYSIELDVQVQSLAASGSVYLSPFGVVNTANYVPITNPVAPGEFITLFGTGLASTTASASLPFPTAGVNGVTVSINGMAAPVYYVSATEIICIVPFELSDPFAVVQVTNNGVTSNAVTLFSDYSAPGIFTQDESGTGAAAVLDAGYSLVTEGNPAAAGKTVSVYGTGLGAVMPPAGDGTAAPARPLSSTDDTMDIYVDGVETLQVTFAGLAPGYAGLYQVNFVVPSTPGTGAVYLDINDEQNGAYNSMATLYVSGTPSGQIKDRASVSRRMHRKLPGRINRDRTMVRRRGTAHGNSRG